MSPDRRKIREIAGFTFMKQRNDHQNWYDLASSFHDAAVLLHSEHQSPSPPFYYNAALSVELLLKSILIAKNKGLIEKHKLLDLAKKTEIFFTHDQECTLELLSQIIIWSGRYPAPRNKKDWDEYYDDILEKHIDRGALRTSLNIGRFPTLENYLKIWVLSDAEYKKLITETT